MKDHYQVLGLPRSANKSQIKNAFRKLALEFHPDRNNGTKISEELFKYIAESYEVLSNPSKKAGYDWKLGQEEKKPFKQNQSQSSILFKNNATKNTYHHFELAKMSKEQLLLYLLIKLFVK